MGIYSQENPPKLQVDTALEKSKVPESHARSEQLKKIPVYTPVVPQEVSDNESQDIYDGKVFNILC